MLVTFLPVILFAGAIVVFLSGLLVVERSSQVRGIVRALLVCFVAVSLLVTLLVVLFTR